MNAKIDALTPEQEDALRRAHADWYAYGTSCEPADRPATEAAITRMYEIIGKPAPQFVWCDSPATGALAVALLSGKVTSKADSLWGSLWDSLRGSLWDSLRGSLGGSLRDSLGGSLRGSLWDSLGGSLWDSLRDSLWDSLGGSLRDSLGDSLGGSLRGSLRGSLWDSLRDSLWDSLRGPLRGSLRDSLRDSLLSRAREAATSEAWWGQQEAFWIAYYLFPEQQHLVTYDPKRSEQLGLWATISRSAGWWFPYDGVVVCTERPVEVHQETVRSSWPYGVTSRRLHREDGPALLYRDGWVVHSWHGIRVPEWVITAPTVDAAIKEPNSEIRRAALEHIGWPAVIQQLGTKPIATCADPGNEPHELTLYALPREFYDERVNLLVMTNGSPDRSGEQRLYGETVPAEITDPLAAAAWQYGVQPSVYADLARRT